RRHPDRPEHAPYGRTRARAPPACPRGLSRAPDPDPHDGIERRDEADGPGSGRHGLAGQAVRPRALDQRHRYRDVALTRPRRTPRSLCMNQSPSSQTGSDGSGLDLSQFYAVFFEEAGENLANMEDSLLELDIETPDDEQLNAIFRCAHSIKGGA